MANKKRIILETAAALFAEKGYTETSISELARLTDSAEGTIFYHFNTKAELFVAILADVKDGILREFDQYMESCRVESGIELMEKVVSFFLFLAGQHEEWFLLLQRHRPYEVARENGICREHLATLYNTLLDLFEGAILKGQEDGSIADVPPKKTALIIFSMVNGLIWLKLNDLYDASTLYQDLLASCRKMLAPGERNSDEVETENYNQKENNHAT